MRDIVEEGPEPLEFYVLQPQNGQAELRQYMVEKRIPYCQRNYREGYGENVHCICCSSF